MADNRQYTSVENSESGETMLENFKRYFQSFADQVESYEVYDSFEIIVTLNDGSQILYDDFDRAIDFISMFNEEEDQRRRFGYRLRKMTRLKGMTQDELAKQTGISKNMLSMYMRGLSVPTLFKASKIAEVLGCTIEDLLHFPK